MLQDAKTLQKFNLARELHGSLPNIRETYKRDMQSPELEVQETAVALYLIDKVNNYPCTFILLIIVFSNISNNLFIYILNLSHTYFKSLSLSVYVCVSKDIEQFLLPNLTQSLI